MRTTVVRDNDNVGCTLPRMALQADRDAAITKVRDAIHARGMRWTPQRRALLEVLFESQGHVSMGDLLQRARSRDPETIPSTIYRTLDVLEDLGLVSHSHAADGRQQIHVLPDGDHGHLECQFCGTTWQIATEEARHLVGAFADTRGFEVDVSHLNVVGRCSACSRTHPD
jgi:Fur family ferric uptake transcriptional regulator